MRILKYFSVLCLGLIALSSCESDLEKTIYNKSQVVTSRLEGLKESYVLEQTKGNDNALSLKWTKPDMTYQAAATNLLQMDIKDKNFSKAITLAASSVDTTYNATVSEFNEQIMTLLNNYDIEYSEGSVVNLEFRIGSYISTVVDTVFSEVSQTDVTPYLGEAVYPSIVVVGSYSSWGFETCQFVYSANSDENYSGMIYFNGKGNEGWKFTKGLGWGTGEWGADGNIEAEAPTANLITSGGGNITAYSKNSYWIEFNSTTGVLKMTQGYNSWGLVGAFNGWSSPDAKMTYSHDEDGAYLTANLLVSADQLVWKIRPDEKWENDKGPGQLSYEGDVEDNGDGNFKFNKGAGTYEVKWYFNKVTPKLIVTKK